ncbi:MAG: thioredoxin domain-containing protein, partial [Candidatus Falkowbacteria bacterium]
SYASLDGTKFFPQAMEIKKSEEPAKQADADSAANSQPPAASVSAKNDKPVVEVFVMSHCPYGTQIEKGILPVVEALGDKIDFQLKFCDYAMHGEVELNEQLRQYCVQQEEPEKLIAYLSCFLKDGKHEPCLTEAGINNTKLQACVLDTDQQYKVTEKFNDKSTWNKDRNGDPAYPTFDVNKTDTNKYGISGSPGLVINGQKIQSNRDPASLLNVICSGFNEAPAECADSLSTATPSAGFGFSATGASSGGGCGG